MRSLDTLTSQAASTPDATQYLTFSLGEQEYGVPILNVQEIKGFTPTTPIPNTPAFVKGVMNLRGTIIPVIDLRARLALAGAEYTAFTVVVVLAIDAMVVGAVVDAVSDVLTIPDADVQRAPDFGADADVRFVAGIAQAAGRLIVLLDAAALVTPDDALPAGDPPKAVA
jgi:purine-binding chemotaxis protein CheW